MKIPEGFPNNNESSWADNLPEGIPEPNELELFESQIDSLQEILTEKKDELESLYKDPQADPKRLAELVAEIRELETEIEERRGLIE